MHAVRGRRSVPPLRHPPTGACTPATSWLARAGVCAALLLLSAIPAPSWAGNAAEAELSCLALNIYHESRGEPDLGKFAVAYVVLNRAHHTSFPHRLCDVVYQHVSALPLGCEFSWTCDGAGDQPTDLSAWQQSVRIARLAYLGLAKDPTAGAMWYHADYIRPKWAEGLPATRIGHHLFYYASGPRPASPIDIETRSPAASSAVAAALPPSMTAFLKQLRLKMIYTPDLRTATVRINEAVYREGDELAPGLTVASIGPTAIVLRYQDRWFRFEL